MENPTQVEVKVTWSLAWGLFWRMALMQLAAGFIFGLLIIIAGG